MLSNETTITKYTQINMNNHNRRQQLRYCSSSCCTLSNEPPTQLRTEMYKLQKYKYKYWTLSKQ